MHINLHKTFSTPHGGGGPGSGPVVLSEALAPFGPLPFVARMADGSSSWSRRRMPGEDHPDAFGRMVAFHGQMGMFTRALAYILSHGADGLKQVAEDAVLNANYILRSLEDVLDAPFGKSGPCMHEAIFSDKGFAGGVSTIDLAKALIDEGFHPMTMYFPLVVHGAMLVEPTETESKASLDQFIMAVRSIAERAKAGDQSLKAAPVHAPRRRLDETLAARKPVLTYRSRRRPRPRSERRAALSTKRRSAGRATLGSGGAAQPRADCRGARPTGFRASGVVLEIASGTGEHAAYFAERFPTLEWQPSDVHPDALGLDRGMASQSGLPNLRPPIALDASATRLAGRARGRGAQHQHGSHQPVVVGARPARRRGANACRGAVR